MNMPNLPVVIDINEEPQPKPTFWQKLTPWRKPYRNTVRLTLLMPDGSKMEAVVQPVTATATFNA